MMTKQRGQLPDGVRGTPIRKIGYHGWKTWELSFESAYAETMIGAEGEVFKVAMGDLDTARVHTAARAIGLARGALERGVPPCRLAGGCGRATKRGGPPGDRTPNPRIKRSRSRHGRQRIVQVRPPRPVFMAAPLYPDDEVSQPP